MTLLSNHFFPVFFCANYCIIVTRNFGPAKAFTFYSGHPHVCTAIIIMMMTNISIAPIKVVLSSLQFSTNEIKINILNK